MTAEVHRSPSPLETVAGAFRILFTQVHLRAMFFAIIAYGASFGAAVPFIPIWLSDSFGSSEFEIGVLIMFRGLGGAIGIPLIGWYADRTGRRRPSIIGSFAVVMVSYLGMVLAPSYEFALALAVLSGMSAVALCFVLVEEILERMPPAQEAYRTTVSAYERTAFNVGGAFGTMLGRRPSVSAGRSLPACSWPACFQRSGSWRCFIGPCFPRRRLRLRLVFRPRPSRPTADPRSPASSGYRSDYFLFLSFCCSR